jgi:uncharacterized protein (TIGR02722 family)
MNNFRIIFLWIITLFFVACANKNNQSSQLKVSSSSYSTPSTVVRYGDPQSIETVTADYGRTDLQSVAETMARSLLQSKIIQNSTNAPLVTLAEVMNKTTEPIDTRMMTEKIRTQLQKSGQVRFAISYDEMQSQANEIKRQNQSSMYRNDGSTKPSRMEGAKFRITGTIGTITKQNRDLKDIYYIFTLNLVNNESGIIEWSEEKEIVKFVSTR